MRTSKRITGDVGEYLACKFLERKGFTILERNFLKPWGEIDIVASKNGIVHFIEVKTVTREIQLDNKSGSREMPYRPEEQFTALKLKKVARTAALYMEQHRDVREFQVDGVAVVLDETRRIARCAYYAQVL